MIGTAGPRRDDAKIPDPVYFSIHQKWQVSNVNSGKNATPWKTTILLDGLNL
jgi:hypothetical protein